MEKTNQVNYLRLLIYRNINLYTYDVMSVKQDDIKYILQFKIEITNTDKWDVNWVDKNEREKILKQLSTDIKEALNNNVGIDKNSINIEGASYAI